MAKKTTTRTPVLQSVSKKGLVAYFQQEMPVFQHRIST